MIDLAILLLKLSLDLVEIGSKSLKLVLVVLQLVSVVRVNSGLIGFDLVFQLMQFRFQFFLLTLQFCSEAFTLSEGTFESSDCSNEQLVVLLQIVHQITSHFCLIIILFQLLKLLHKAIILLQSPLKRSLQLSNLQFQVYFLAF